MRRPETDLLPGMFPRASPGSRIFTRLSPPTAEETPMTEQKFPPGWDEARVQRLIAHYEAQDEDVQVAEDEAAQQAEGQSVVVVPSDLVPAIRQMLAHKPCN